MALSAAERQKKRRDKLKETGQYEDFKKKHCLEVKRSYLKKKQQWKELPKRVQMKLDSQRKQNIRTRVALCRKQKKKVSELLAIELPASPVYSSKVAYGRAFSRAKRNLPTTPRRRKEIVKRLFTTEVSETFPKASTPRSTSLSADTRTLVKDYYERDDISRQAPGRKDVLSIRNDNGEKVKLQTRHLLSSITEVYGMFCNDHPNIKIGKSKFAELRPGNVRLSCKLPHNVCLCKYHENFINATNALSKVCNTIPSYSQEFPESLLCEKKSKVCWLNKCSDCKDGEVFKKRFSDEIEHVEVNWYVWRSENEKTISKVMEEGTTVELIEYIVSLIPRFLEHVFVKRKQFESYQHLKENVLHARNPVKAMIQVDFSENYTCVAQDEIQSAHWQQNQISLFTSCLWYDGSMHPVVLVSDNINHSKDTVVAYIDNLLDQIPTHVKETEIWSDGPASQFKNRFVASSLLTLQEKHQVTLKWNFLATSHGKGPIDGIGGAVKRKVWDLVKKRRFIVQSASQFLQAAQQPPTSVQIFEMNQEEILARNEVLDLKSVFNQAIPIEGISKLHCFVVREQQPVGFLLSEDIVLGEEQNSIRQCSVRMGEWYEVEYEGKMYAGEIKEINRNNDEYLVNAMEPIGKYWKWPSQPDEVYYSREKLIRKLSLPIVINSRGHYKFI